MTYQDILKAIAPYVSTQTIIIVIVVSLVFKLREVLRTFTQNSNARLTKIEADISLMKIRQAKVIKIIEKCKSPTKQWIGWLRDDKLNSDPPGECNCKSIKGCVDDKK